MYTKELINNLDGLDLFNQSKENNKSSSNLAVAMGRVSTKEQKDQGQSDDAQMIRIRSYAENNKLIIKQEWNVAETASKHSQRKNFLALVKLVRESQETKFPIKHIIFSHQSRSNRNRESAREIEMLIKLYQVTLHCVRDNLILHADSPFDDWLRWDIFNNLNAKFIEDHRKNVFDGTKGRLALGLFPGKWCYGYRNKRLPGGLSVFILQEDEAEYIRTAFQLFSRGGLSAKKLYDQLGDMFPSTKPPTSHKSLYTLLRRRFYYGEFEYKGTVFKGHPEYHPRIIDYKTWVKVQELIDGPKRNKVDTKELHYMKMITCDGYLMDEEGNLTDEKCGWAVTGDTTRKKHKDGTIKKHKYYHCGNNKGKCSQRNVKHMKEVADRRKGYTPVEIENLFEEMFRPLAFTTDQVKWMQELLLSQHKKKSKNYTKKLGALQKKKKMLESYMDKAYEDKLKGLITEEMWSSKNSRWMLENSQVTEELDQIDCDKREYIEEGINLIELAQHTESIYKSASPEVKRKLVEIVSSNRLLRDGSIEFYYRKPFNWLAEPKGCLEWWRWWESNPRPKQRLGSGLRV